MEVDPKVDNKLLVDAHEHVDEIFAGGVASWDVVVVVVVVVAVEVHASTNEVDDCLEAVHGSRKVVDTWVPDADSWHMDSDDVVVAAAASVVDGAGSIVHDVEDIGGACRGLADVALDAVEGAGVIAVVAFAAEAVALVAVTADVVAVVVVAVVVVGVVVVVAAAVVVAWAGAASLGLGSMRIVVAYVADSSCGFLAVAVADVSRKEADTLGPDADSSHKGFDDDAAAAVAAAFAADGVGSIVHDVADTGAGKGLVGVALGVVGVEIVAVASEGEAVALVAVTVDVVVAAAAAAVAVGAPADALVVVAASWAARALSLSPSLTICLSFSLVLYLLLSAETSQRVGPLSCPCPSMSLFLRRLCPRVLVCTCFGVVVCLCVSLCMFG